MESSILSEGAKTSESESWVQILVLILTLVKLLTSQKFDFFSHKKSNTILSNNNGYAGELFWLRCKYEVADSLTLGSS